MPEPNPSRSAPLDELFVRYWDDALTEPQRAELERALAADPGAREAFTTFCLQVVGITERQTAEKLARAAAAPPRTPARWLLRFAAAAGVGALVLAGLVGLVVWVGSPAVAGKVEQSSGVVHVIRRAGDQVAADPGTPIRSGDTVATLGLDSSAAVSCPDGTRLLLVGDTSVTWSGEAAARVTVTQGSVTADLAAAPTDPMRIVTSEADIEAPGARVSITRAGQTTQVGVVEGQARIWTPTHPDALEVFCGEEAIAPAGRPVRKQPRPPPPDTFALRFSPDLPPAWKVGEPVGAALLPGSEGAVRAVAQCSRFGLRHQIRSINRWNDGLFVLQPDTWVSLRFRVERPGFFHLLLVARDPDFGRTQATIWEAKDFYRGREPGKWYEEDLSAARFRPTRESPPPYGPQVVYEFVLDSAEVDRGLTLDQLWVSRGPRPGPFPE